jgi:hypothetical protein
MRTLTARIDDQLFQETKQQADSHGIAISEYLRTALKILNAEYAKKDRHSRLKKSSLEARNISQQINAEFSAFEGDDFE